MSLLNQILITRDARLNEFVELVVKNVEHQLTYKPSSVSVSVNVSGTIGYCDVPTAVKLVELLVGGGLKATLNAGLMQSYTTIDFDLSGLDTPWKTLDFRVAQFRNSRLQELSSLVFDNIKKQVTAMPSVQTVLIDLYTVTGIKDSGTWDYIVKTLNDGGLEAKLQVGYNTTIQVTLPALDDKSKDQAKTYTLNDDEQALLKQLYDGKEDFTIRRFLVVVFDFTETKSQKYERLIEDWLMYHNVYAFTQSLAVEKLTEFLSKNNVNVEIGKIDLKEHIPCTPEEWRHCDDIHFVLKSVCSSGEGDLCLPLFNAIMARI